MTTAAYGRPATIPERHLSPDRYTIAAGSAPCAFGFWIGMTTGAELEIRPRVDGSGHPRVRGTEVVTL